jgi:hypothetical protein
MPAARVELIEAQDWYERKARGLGGRFRDEVDFQVDRIAAHPMRFPEILPGARRVRLRRFPYGLFYVIACFHSSRDPLVWRSRI